MQGVLRWLAAGLLVALFLLQPSSAATLEEMQLHNAAQYCYLDEIAALLDRGVDIDARSSGGHTPLIKAVYGQCAEGVRLLLERGADPFIENDAGESALDTARLYGYSDMTAILTDSTPSTQTAEPEWAEEELEDFAEDDFDLDGDDAIDLFAPEQQSAPQSQAGIKAGPGMCKDMYLSCQSTCGYFSGGQWIMDYSCTAQCSECNRACEAGHVTACTDTFRPWGGQ